VNCRKLRASRLKKVLFSGKHQSGTFRPGENTGETPEPEWGKPLDQPSELGIA
jgi:hypothetical protein